jgi:hypothetical protein
MTARYEPHLITCIDILGFRELVAKKSPNFISHAIRRVQEITGTRRFRFGEASYDDSK